jgi:MerR family mercuric resistance operon transcriptional regulator
MISIGVLSTKTKVNIETIRYYEKIGLMPRAPRKASGHRIYGNDLVDRLMFIRRGRELGFSLDDIRNLMGMEDGKPSCADVHALTEKHLRGIRSKIADLKKLEKTLSHMAARCVGGQTPDCPVIEALAHRSQN